MNKDVLNFPKIIYPKLNVLTWRTFKLAYFEAAVQYFCHYVTGPLCIVHLNARVKMLCITHKHQVNMAIGIAFVFQQTMISLVPTVCPRKRIDIWWKKITARCTGNCTLINMSAVYMFAFRWTAGENELNKRKKMQKTCFWNTTANMNVWRPRGRACVIVRGKKKNSSYF